MGILSFRLLFLGLKIVVLADQPKEISQEKFLNDYSMINSRSSGIVTLVTTEEKCRTTPRERLDAVSLFHFFLLCRR